MSLTKRIAIPAMAILGLCIPYMASAHVKWFTGLPPVKESIEHILSPFFLTTALLTAALLAVLTQLLPLLMRVPALTRLDRTVENWRALSYPLLRYGTAIGLAWGALEGTLLAPEFELHGTALTIVVWAAAALLVVPHHYATKAGALALIGLFVYGIAEYGLFHLLDYGFYVAIAGALLLERTRWQAWAFPALYLGTGLSLCWVAVEKWIYPNMSLDIVAHHGVPTFGFAPGPFIVLCAFIEFVVGYLLVVGILNRVLSIVLTIIFILTTTLFGYTEIVGHFIIHIVLLIFIIEGTSFYKPPVEMHQGALNRVVFIMLNFLFVLATFLLIYYRFA
ncbi:hypothetical protein [Cohnella sp. GCM10027633]|uniref:hypothetical protein n=1 Tax=unclassified Cohnella TaxID=2636738 RepID=UPI003633E829